MANFIFEELLSPIDFEHLVRDVLSRNLGLELTAFGEGKDGGVDLRYSEGRNNEIIVQCKRSKNISRKLLNEERTKIEKIGPKKYYFVTSCELSVNRQNEIKLLFADWMDGDLNIYTKNRLNNLLDEYPDILQKHYKLWLYSSVIFNTLISKPLYERSKALTNDIQRNYKFFVKNDSIYKSLEILNKNQFIIISGIPGIGKTTLAKMLLMEYLMNGYEIIEIRKVTDGEQLLSEDSKNKQVFYFDDFLGENFLKYDVIEGRSNDLVQFIKRIMNNKHKVLIMTTREYILQQAKDRYEKLDSEEFNVFKYTLDLSSYSKRIKTMILYNHLFYSGIDEKYIANLIRGKKYKQIINHKNYSPRIIEHMTMNIDGIDSDKYAETFIESLEKPFKIWDKAFSGQISEGAKLTSYLLLSVGDNILLSDFHTALLMLHKKSSMLRNYDFSPLEFKNYIKELEGSFVKVDLSIKGNHFISFQNPSVKDFLLELISNDQVIVELLIDSAKYFKQFIYTINYIAKKFLTNESTKNVIDKVILERFDDFKNFTYIYSQNKEMDMTINPIEKLYELRNYLQHQMEGEVAKFLFKKFHEIDYSNRFGSPKKYIEFFKKFMKQVKVDFESLMTAMIKNIYWIDDARDINLLQEINPELFDKTKNKNVEIFKENFNSALEKDLSFANSVDSVINLKRDIDEGRKVWNIMNDDDDTEIDNKITTRLTFLEEKENKEVEKEEPILVDEEKVNDAEFDEDIIFNQNMF